MNPWRAILGFFTSGQLSRGIAFSLPAEEVVKIHRVSAPINTAITLTQHETGITFDFPIRDTIRSVESERAWRLLHIGLFLAVASVFGCVAIPSTWTPGVFRHQLFGYPFGIGLIVLVIAAHISSRAIREDDANDAEKVQQLSVAGNLLVRKSRNLRKQVWYEHEIRDIVLTQSAIMDPRENAGQQTCNLRLDIRLHNGEIVQLITWNAVVLTVDAGPREELEWVATRIRLALFPRSSVAEPPSADDPHANAIQVVKDDAADKNRRLP